MRRLTALGAAFKRGRGALGRMLGAGLAVIGVQDLSLALGLALLGYGLSLVYWPAGFIAPGVVLIAVAIFGVR